MENSINTKPLLALLQKGQIRRKAIERVAEKTDKSEDFVYKVLGGRAMNLEVIKALMVEAEIIKKINEEIQALAS